VKVLLVHGANPLYDLPQKQAFLDALKQVPFVVSFAPIADETSSWADLVLPDRTYLESWGYDVVSPSFGVQAIGSQQPVVAPVYDNRSTADVLLAVAKDVPAAAGALAWKDEVEFLKEVVAQLPNNGNKDLGWAQFLQHGGWWQSSPVSPAAPATPAGAAAAAPVNVQPPQYEGGESDFPYYLQISMSELLSDGRGANQPWLQGSPDVNTTIAWQTWLEMNPATAQKLGLLLGELVKVSSPYGSIEAPVYFFPAIRPDTVAVPLGQGHSNYGRYATNRGANALALLNPQQGGGAAFLNWSALRIKIEKTGRRMRLAGFEGGIGNTQELPQGFPNKGNP
jgi:anaerobic selenocysteine-containing dehydrogenase